MKLKLHVKVREKISFGGHKVQKCDNKKFAALISLMNFSVIVNATSSIHM